VDVAGYKKVLLGSDYPFDMGNLDCVRRVEEIDIAREQRDSILGLRAKALLNGSS
jgi:predicted TIM-barrel fold metal-dependent hydrolase